MTVITRITIALVLLFISAMPLLAQPTEDETVYTSVEQPPQFPGGDAALMDFIRTNLKIPQSAIKAEVGGRIYVGFIVNKVGMVEDVRVQKGLGYGLDEETERVIKSLPVFTPGRQNGQPVKVRMVWPIKITPPGGEPPINYSISAKKPEFPGGERALYQYLKDHTEFNKSTKNLKVPYWLEYRLLINEKGKIDSIQAVSKVDMAINEVLVNAIKKLPDWTPGKEHGKQNTQWIKLTVLLNRNGNKPVEVVVP